MGHQYVKESDTFSTGQNGTVPKPTAQEVSDNKFLRADGAWSTGGGGASELNDLSDVNLSTPTNNQALLYNSSNSKWQNGIVMPCQYKGTINANSYVDISVTEGTYLFSCASTSIHGLVVVSYDSQNGGEVSTAVINGLNMNVFTFTKQSSGVLRIKLNNAWARPIVLWKVI